MCNLGEAILERGIERGRVQTIEEMAVSLYDKGMPEAFIMEVTKLSKEELTAILKRNKRLEETVPSGAV